MLLRIAKRIMLVLVTIAVVGLLAWAFMPRPVEVETAAVTRGLLEVTVDDDGQTRIRDRYIISAPLAGRMRRIELDPGDAVEPGSPLAVIEPADPELLDPRAHASARARVRAAEAALQQAEAGVEQAQARLDLARLQRDRLHELRERDAATQHELDEAVATERVRDHEHQAAQFAERVAAFELQMARAALLRTPPSGGEADFEIQPPPQLELHPGIDGADLSPHAEPVPELLAIHSPLSGRVLRVEQESEAFVTPGQRLIEIGDPQQLELEVDVLSTDAVAVSPRDTAYIEHWGGEEALRAVVRRVEPQAFTRVSALGVEEQRVNVILDFTSPSEAYDRLGDGYRVEARIVVWAEDEVLRVPTAAIFRHGGAWAVYRVAEGRAHLQPIRVGQSTDLLTQVLDGLGEEDVVIIHPADRVTDGARVTPRERR